MVKPSQPARVEHSLLRPRPYQDNSVQRSFKVVVDKIKQDACSTEKFAPIDGVKFKNELAHLTFQGPGRQYRVEMLPVPLDEKCRFLPIRRFDAKHGMRSHSQFLPLADAGRRILESPRSSFEVSTEERSLSGDFTVKNQIERLDSILDKVKLY